jgi:hypothetical protein
MEYYGYAERSADSQVDWATIGKGMTDMLSETNRIREAKKDAIDQASRDYSKTLTEVPLGEHVGAREYALRFASNASEYRLMQDRLLKSGALKLKDYTVNRQNLLDGTDQAFTMLKDFQAQAAEKMQRYKDSDSQAYELEGMNKLEGWGKFNESDLFINPTTGAITIGKVTNQTIDGKTVRTMSQNPGDFTTIANAQANLYGRYDKYKYEEPLKAWVGTLGEELTVLRQFGSETRAGSISSLLSIKQRSEKINGVIKSFEASETEAINGMIGNDFNRLSILTENIKTVNGQPFKFVYSEKDRTSENDLYMKKDPNSGMTVPQFTEKQSKMATEFIRGQARLQYDNKQTITPYTEPTKRSASEAEIATGESRKSKIATASLWNNYYLESDPAKKNNVLQAILGSPEAKAQGIIGIDAESEPGFLLIKNDTDSQSRRIKLSDIKNLNDWSQIGTGVHGISDKNILNKATGGGNPNFASTATWKGRAMKGETLGYNEAIKQLTPELFTSGDPQRLVDIIKDLGLNIETDYLDDDVHLTIGEGNAAIEYTANVDDGADAAIQAQNLKAWLDENVTLASKAAKTSGSSTTVTGGNTR